MFVHVPQKPLLINELSVTLQTNLHFNQNFNDSIMKKIHLLLLVMGACLLSSCGAFKSYIASYSVGLSAVESPADAKQQFGETKVVTFDEEGVSKYRYEDDYINITPVRDKK